VQSVPRNFAREQEIAEERPSSLDVADPIEDRRRFLFGVVKRESALNDRPGSLVVVSIARDCAFRRQRDAPNLRAVLTPEPEHPSLQLRSANR